MRSISMRPHFFLFFALAALPSIAGAQSATINKVTYESKPGESSGEELSPEESMRIKRLFLFPSVDDVSGVLAPKLDQKVVRLFSNSRFELVRDAQVIKALSPDDASYAKAAQNAEVHREAARITKADTTVLLRTKNVGNLTELTLELRDASGSLLYAESGTVPGYSPIEARWSQIEKLYNTIIEKIPFRGTITGRTAKTLTLDLGMGDVRQGEEVDIARVVSVQRHPLLNTVVSADYVRQARAKIVGVDKTISFAEIIEEYPGESVSTGSKIVAVQKTGRLTLAPKDDDFQPRQRRHQGGEKEEDFSDDRLKGDFDQTKARYGSVGLNVQYGSITHNHTLGTTTEVSGGGLGGNIDAEIWITKNWIASIYYGFQNGTLSGSSTGSVGDASWNRIDVLGGYRIYPAGLGANAFISGLIGYQMQKFDLPAVSTFSLGGRKYAGILARINAEIAFLPRQMIAVGFGLQPFSSLTEVGPSLGVTDGGTAIGVYLDWKYLISDTLWVRLGFQFDTASGNYTNSATTAEKRFAIGPGIQYSF